MLPFLENKSNNTLQDNHPAANMAVQRRVADYHANAVYFDLVSAFSVGGGTNCPRIPPERKI